MWQSLLIGALVVNAIVGFAYRLYRYRKGGPIGDVIGQGILGALLIALALGVAAGAGWGRWGGFAYAVLFGVIVMPVWVLAVLIPLRPGALDYSFAALYWVALLLAAVAALLA